MTNSPALPGFYNFLFLHLEPLSTMGTGLSCLLYPGAAWYWNELVPGSIPTPPLSSLDPRTVIVIWQLSGCYFLLGLMSSILFRVVRDALPDNLPAQERILGASLAALAVADVTHIFTTLIGLPADVRFDFANWNIMTHGNITIVVLLLISRMAWFAGVGRKRYYFGQPDVKVKKT